MADRLPKFGDFSIPSGVIDSHEWASDAIIDSLGKNCKLVYPAKVTECNNCYYDPRTRRSTGIYKSGGPISFPNNTTCPACGGAGRSTVETTESIKLRVYWNPKDWQTFAGTIQNPEGVAQVIGYMSDLPKVERSVEVIINSDVESTKEYRCVKEGEAVPWGFRQDRYFLQFYRRSGGG